MADSNGVQSVGYKVKDEGKSVEMGGDPLSFTATSARVSPEA